MVPAVRVYGGGLGQHGPHRESSDMRAHNQGAQHDGEGVGEDVLDGMGVDGYHADGRGPLVVLLVDVLVEPGMVGQSDFEQKLKVALAICNRSQIRVYLHVGSLKNKKCFQ